MGKAALGEADLKHVVGLPLEDVSDFYNRSVASILLKKPLEAIEMLYQAIEQDGIARLYARVDDLFDPIRSTPEFQRLIA
jgi:hypothetical protein